MSINKILSLCIQLRLITTSDMNDINLMGVNSWRKKGYPLLHLLCNKVEASKGEGCLYFLAAKALLESGASPNILSHHAMTPLQFAAQDGDECLVKMLIHQGANPDLRSGTERTGLTALEFAAFKCSTDERIIAYLARKTNINNRIRQGCQEALDDAITSWESDHSYANQINFLIENKLAVAPFVQAIKNDCPYLNEGCWVRMIPSVTQELKILKKRKGLSEELLHGHRQMKVGELDATNSYYTPYSPATFVSKGLPVSLYSRNDVGVIIKQVGRAIDYWYDGHQEELTNRFSFKNGSPLANGQREGQMWSEKEDKIQLAVRERFQASFSSFPLEKMDRHGVLKQKKISEIFLSWNEGLFRYQAHEIVGIVVRPAKKSSAMAALKLRRGLRQALPFYAYNARGGAIRVRSASLMEGFNLDKYGRENEAKKFPSIYRRSRREARHDEVADKYSKDYWRYG